MTANGKALLVVPPATQWPLLLDHHAISAAAAAGPLCCIQACPDDAKLWCALGDITQQDEHYVKAWEVSNHRSSRAQRSLGRWAGCVNGAGLEPPAAAQPARQPAPPGTNRIVC